MNLNPDVVSTALKMMIILGIILAGLLIILHYTKKLLRKDNTWAQDKPIRILASSYIGVKKSISLIEIPGTILVLGITNDNICLLDKIENNEAIEKIKNHEPHKTWPSFSEQLQKLSSKLKK